MAGSGLAASDSTSHLGEGVLSVRLGRGEDPGIGLATGAAQLRVNVSLCAKGSPCDRAGVQPGVLHSICGEQIDTKEDLFRVVMRCKAEGQLLLSTAVDTPDGRRWYNVRLNNKEESLGMQYTVMRYMPVVVSWVTAGGPCARAGLCEGLRITAVDREPVQSCDSVSAALKRASQSGGSVLVTVSAPQGVAIPRRRPSDTGSAHRSAGNTFSDPAAADISRSPLNESLCTFGSSPGGGAPSPARSAAGGRRSPGLSAPRRRPSANKTSSVGADELDADRSYSSVSGIPKAVSVNNTSIMQAPSDVLAASAGTNCAPPSVSNTSLAAPAATSRPRRRSGKKTEGAAVTPPQSPSPGGLLASPVQPARAPAAASASPARSVGFVDTDGDQVLLQDTGRGGIELVVNGETLGVLHTMQYCPASGALTDAIGGCVLPAAERLRLEGELAALAEASGVSHNIPLAPPERFAVILWSADEALGMEYDVHEDGGVTIRAVLPGGPLARAEVPQGMLVALDDHAVVGRDGLQRAVAGLRERARQGKASFFITVRRRPEQEQLLGPMIAVEPSDDPASPPLPPPSGSPVPSSAGSFSEELPEGGGRKRRVVVKKVVRRKSKGSSAGGDAPPESG
eukprot:TRINITY_DN47539_c0_g1_i1.p1 TRINITY_DN47539_c0_g1~~TRINITY_DN47539_c0_g1_i1.p1  ORF type:complete len:657 (+),score=209.94 TRINITY_DN47539_c0_g1_i1:98-1972(+)